MDSTFFIAEKLRGIPLVSGSGAKQQPKNRIDDDDGDGDEKTKRQENENEASKHSASGGVQLEKRDVDASSMSSNAILFKSAGITASTSNVRKKQTTNKPTTAIKWLTTTTTRRPPTTTTTRASTTRRKQQVAATTTRRPSARQLAKLESNKQPAAQTATTTTTTSTTTESEPSSTFTPSPTRGKASTEAAAAATRTTLKKFDKLVNQYNQEAEFREPANHLQQSTASSSSSSSATTAAQLPLVSQPFSQRRTLQPILGPQRFTNDHGRSGQSAGENWAVAFNRPDGGYSLFEVLVLLSSIIMVSTIVLVIISNWFKSFKRRKAAAAAAAATTTTTTTQQQKSRRDDEMQASHSVVDLLGQPTSMMGNLQTSAHNKNGAEDAAGRKISMISSGLTSLSTTTTPTDLASSSVASANNTNTIINMPASASAALANEAKRLVGSVQQQVFSASQNISSEIKQAAGNISNKAMAIVQPTENNNNNNASSTPTSASAARTADQDSISVMSDALTKPTDKMSAKMRPINADEKLMETKETAAAAAAKRDQPQQQEVGGGATKQLQDLFNSTTSETINSKREEMKEKTEKKKKKEKKEPVSRAGSLESIELPATLVESIKRIDGAKVVQPDEAPSPNLLLGEREPAAVVVATAAADSIEAAVETKPSGQPEKSTEKDERPTRELDEKQQRQPPDEKRTQKTGGNKDQDLRPGNPMGRDNKPTPSKESATVKPTPKTTPTTTTMTAEVKNHQVVVNKLDKRKTNLEIVDLRDESVTGKMRAAKDEPRSESSASVSGGDGNWISMNGVAVVQPAPGTLPVQSSSSSSSSIMQQQLSDQQQADQQVALMSPSEIIESRFHVDYKGKRRGQLGATHEQQTGSKDSNDSRANESLANNIESELEQDNKMRNRKYFVYIVHDGHFTAKKECIARLELPPKRRITLAEMRQLIANSQDISLTSLRRNKFKFVTETYRLLNENEDATILHQVYPTQGVFLKLNIPEQENQAYVFKGGRASTTMGGRLSTGSGGFGVSGAGAAGGAGSSLASTTIASRRRAGASRQRQQQQQDGLPAIEVDGYALADSSRGRAASVSRRNRQPAPGGSYRRSKSSLVQGRGSRQQQQQQQQQQRQQMTASHERLPSIGRSTAKRNEPKVQQAVASKSGPIGARKQQAKPSTLGEAATDLGQNVLSGAKKLFESTFKR